MMQQPAERSIVIEREIPQPIAKVWRALTEGHLIAEWLMANDFRAEVGHRFTFRAEPNPHWNGVTECEVLAVEPQHTLSYSWNASGAEAANGLKTVVTFTLVPAGKGVLLRMEQSGFRAQDENNLRGAQYGWQRFLGKLDEVVAREA
jgi:uncharacterized protein YndB with AHSA1/START domain